LVWFHLKVCHGSFQILLCFLHDFLVLSYIPSIEPHSFWPLPLEVAGFFSKDFTVGGKLVQYPVPLCFFCCQSHWANNFWKDLATNEERLGNLFPVFLWQPHGWHPQKWLMVLPFPGPARWCVKPHWGGVQVFAVSNHFQCIAEEAVDKRSHMCCCHLQLACLSAVPQNY
jgi:hypothetical protein